MKKLILILLLLPLLAQAQNATTDKVVVSSSSVLTLNDQTSNDKFFTVSLQGSRHYTAFQMNIHIPDGMTVALGNNAKPNVSLVPSGFFPSDIINIYGMNIPIPRHQLTVNMNAGNILTVACLSLSSEDFLENSGDLFNVYVNTTAYMKPGDVDIVIDNVVLTANEITQGDGIYHAVSYKPSVPCGGTIQGVSGACTMPLNVSAANHWSTCILPFATALPGDVKAYTSSTYDENSIFLTEAESIEAYTPYILYSENGFSGNVSGTVDPEQYPERGYVTAGNLTGAIVPQTATEGFVLQKHGEVVQFYAIRNGDSFNIPAGKCWMNIPSNNISAFNFVISDDEDAILSVDATETTDAATYDLTGRRISKIERGGLYIKNGKKFIQTK